MHFWINKSQGCGFNGRYVPPSISSGARRHCGSLSFAPKPMVTPVHRFQSIESVSSAHHAHAHNGAGGGGRSNRLRFPPPGGGRTLTPVVHLPEETVAPQLTRPTAGGTTTTTAKLKCGIWAIISLVPFMIVAGKYYLNGENIGAEVLVFFILLVLILLVIGFVSLFEAFTQKDPSQMTHQAHRTRSRAYEITEEVVHPLQHVSQLEDPPPPPYHIAVMLPPRTQRTCGSESPPPTYDKAIVVS